MRKRESPSDKIDYHKKVKCDFCCPICGSDIFVREDRKETTKVCSRKCMSSYMSGNHITDNCDKLCNGCNVVKSIKLFDTKAHHAHCIDCNDKRSKAWIAENREKRNSQSRKSKLKSVIRDGRWSDSGQAAKASREFMELVKSKPCTDCGCVFDICCMDFDHRDGTVKEHNIGTLFAHHRSLFLIKKEIEKCDLVCSNCHRIRTRDRHRKKSQQMVEKYKIELGLQ